MQIKRWVISFIDWRHLVILEKNPPKNLEFIRFGIWVKRNPIPQFSGDRPGTGWEAIAIFHKPGKKVWNGKGRAAVYNYGTTRYGNFKKSFHPAGKPIPLLIKLLEDFSFIDELILDPFFGSGSTAIACEQLNRRWIGIEISEKYCEIAAKRIEEEVKQLKLFGPEVKYIKPKQKPIFNDE